MANHLGGKLQLIFLTPPTGEFLYKGNTRLVDGINDHTDHNINWIGWYVNNLEIKISTKNLDFKRIRTHFLDNQKN